MVDPRQSVHRLFEDEVRRIARALWPGAEFGGAEIIEGRERDGVFETEDCVHIVEATTSKQKAKAEEDSKKISKLVPVLQKRHPTKAIKGWFVTETEPTADQRTAVHRYKGLISAVSLSQFQSRLIDSPGYLLARDHYPFGSVRDPGSGDPTPKVGYIALDLIDSTGNAVNVNSVIEQVVGGARFVVLGDYGAGKSMTLRHIYHQLRKQFDRKACLRFPIYINLRDHFGQSDPAEILERHARNVGFSHPFHLVRAWRSGYAVLIIDGFDEITTLNIEGLWRRLKDNRFRAMESVRRFVRENPSGSGLVLAGRAHFFHNAAERRNALSLKGNFTELALGEFTDDQVEAYLRNSGLAGTIPSWLPSRPLLVGYLASRGLLQDLGDGGASVLPAEGWNRLLDLVSAREAEIEVGIDGLTVRRLLERLATRARCVGDGLGPLTVDDLTGAFREVCGYPADDRGMILLQRLPGIGIDTVDDDTRRFVDEDFADTCRAGDPLRILDQPFSIERRIYSEIEHPMGQLGIDVAIHHLQQAKLSAGKVTTAIRSASKHEVGQLALDLCRVALDAELSIDTDIYLSGLTVPSLELISGSANTSKLVFQECYFLRLEIDSNVDVSKLPKFQGCYIGELVYGGPGQLPPGLFDEHCIVDATETPDTTTDEILGLALSVGTRVLLTVLQKLYRQRGRGRKEGALFRGLDHRDRRVVPDVLRLLQTEGLAIPNKSGGEIVWLPTRRSLRRVGRIMSSPRAEIDPVIRSAEQL